MRRNLVAVLAIAVVGGLGLFVGGCSSGCGHCEDPCYAEEVCHDGCAPVECEPCGECLEVWYQCPCCGTTSAYDDDCTHCGRHLEVKHSAVAVSPEGCAGPRSGGYGWQIEIAQAEQAVRARAATKRHDCPKCAKKAAPPKHQDCAECAKKAAPPQHQNCAECARKTAPKHQNCAECAKKAAPPQHQDCAECARQNAQPQRRTVVREKPAPKPMSVRKASAKPSGGD